MSLAAKHDTRGGLDLAGLGELASMLDSPQKVHGYKMYDVARIHPDENNSRRADNPGFSQESIAEMAATIRERVLAGKRGLLSPISLRPHPTIPGDFLINHGHRRYLGTIKAGLHEIAGFEDPDFDDVDQFIENVQRENLTAREIGDFLGRKLSQGMSQADIARMMGKSKAWVSQHMRMLNLPAPVAEAVANGLVTDVTLASELAAAHREDPVAVQEVLQGGAKPTRAVVKAIRKPKVNTEKATVERPASSGPQADRVASAEAAFAKMRAARARQESERPAIQGAGQAALQRLLPIAQGDTGQAGVVARFLLNLYNGNRFPFDNTDLRRLDHELCEDCIAVLRMDSRPVQEVHTYFENGSKIWEQMAQTWGFKDFYGEDSWR